MLQFYAQTETPSPTAVPTATPTPTPTMATDISGYIGQVLDSLLGIDILFVLKVLVTWLFIIWIVFALWVAVDAMQRYRNPLFAILWFVFVAPFNFLGLIGYLFIRPTLTLEEKEWTKLEGKYLMHELSNINDCPQCKTMVPTSSNYCIVCGYQMNTTCGKCEYVQSVFNNYCLSCGEKLREDAPEVSTVKTKEATAKISVSTPATETPVSAASSVAETMTSVSTKLQSAMGGFISSVQTMFEKKKAASRLETAVTEEKAAEPKEAVTETAPETKSAQQGNQNSEQKKGHYHHNHHGKHHKKRK
ncbi:MAG: hypothetical protein QY314_03475 [Candidatus Dojkabacteria bacterium]|nr:MAG: hypothetical protein QY314_03475 [Candidatus Dojkabacteria bacterium]